MSRGLLLGAGVYGFWYLVEILTGAPAWATSLACWTLIGLVNAWPVYALRLCRRLGERAQRALSEARRLHEDTRRQLRASEIVQGILQARKGSAEEKWAQMAADDSGVAAIQLRHALSESQELLGLVYAADCQVTVAKRHQDAVDVAIEGARAHTRRMNRWTGLLLRSSELALAASRLLDGSTSSGPAIVGPPAALLCRILRFCCSSITYEEIVFPIMGDMHEEYFKALDSGRPWKARWEHAKAVVNVFRLLGFVIVPTRAVDAVVRWLFTPRD